LIHKKAAFRPADKHIRRPNAFTLNQNNFSFLLLLLL
jgi:hypothetical protein